MGCFEMRHLGNAFPVCGRSCPVKLVRVGTASESTSGVLVDDMAHRLVLGDVVEVGIDGLGVLRNDVVAA